MAAVSESKPADMARIELRGLVRRELVEAIDAMAMANGQDRITLVADVLEEYVYRRLHEVSVLQRALRGNPLLEEAARIGLPD